MSKGNRIDTNSLHVAVISLIPYNVKTRLPLTVTRRVTIGARIPSAVGIDNNGYTGSWKCDWQADRFNGSRDNIMPVGRMYPLSTYLKLG